MAATCVHGDKRVCGLEPNSREVRWFLDTCDMHEFNCEYSTSKTRFRLLSSILFLASAGFIPYRRQEFELATS